MKSLLPHTFTVVVTLLVCRLLLPSAGVPAIFAAARAPMEEAPASNDSVRYEVVDSIVYVPVSRVDTSLVGSNIFKILTEPQDGRAPVRIRQDQKVEEAMMLRSQANKERTFEGYRVRIFFKESARAESEEIQKTFAARYPGVPAYRSYANPYFKVTVGDFRTKSEAMQLMSRIIADYPTAFVVKEAIHYPVVDKANTYFIDTVQVFKPIRIIPAGE